MKVNSAPVWIFKPTEDFAKASAEELQSSGLFKEVFYSQRESDGELLFRGRIDSTNYIGSVRSYGLSVYGPLLWIFGLPTGRIENEVVVRLSLVDHANNTLWSGNYKRNYKVNNAFIYSLPSDFQYDILYKSIMMEAIHDLESKLVDNKKQKL
jgi:hypothetical protein